MIADGREAVGQDQEAVRAYEELLEKKPDDAEALDRVAHLYFRVGDSKSGIDRCKRANHLGASTVFKAWEADYYKGAVGKPVCRPPREVPGERLRIVELPDGPKGRSR